MGAIIRIALRYGAGILVTRGTPTYTASGLDVSLFISQN